MMLARAAAIGARPERRRTRRVRWTAPNARASANDSASSAPILFVVRKAASGGNDNAAWMSQPAGLSAWFSPENSPTMTTAAIAAVSAAARRSPVWAQRSDTSASAGHSAVRAMTQGLVM